MYLRSPFESLILEGGRPRVDPWEAVVKGGNSKKWNRISSVIMHYWIFNETGDD